MLAAHHHATILATLVLVAGLTLSRRFTFKPPPDDYHDSKWIGPDFEPGYLGDLHRAALDRVPDFHPSAWRIVTLIDAEARERTRHCCGTFLRFHQPKSGRDLLILRRCYEWLCPICADVMHYKRCQYVARKIASLSPANDPLPQTPNDTRGEPVAAGTGLARSFL